METDAADAIVAARSRCVKRGGLNFKRVCRFLMRECVRERDWVYRILGSQLKIMMRKFV